MAKRGRKRSHTFPKMEKKGQTAPALQKKNNHKIQKHAHVHTYSLVCCQRSTGCS